MQLRAILLVDMDAFFSAVHQRDNPDLRGKPVAVGSTERRGVIATASYEAREYGVGSAMPTYKAEKLCPNLILIKPDSAKYREVSRQIHEIFLDYTSQVQRVSIDEAYLDVSSEVDSIREAASLAQSIKDDIYRKVDLTATVGVSVNKFLAKVASEHEKPDGLTILAGREVDEFLAKLPIGDFRGVGKKTTKKMLNLGIETGADLRELSKERIIELFGERKGTRLHKLARGIDRREVTTKKRKRKSINVSYTFQHDVYEDREAYECLKRLSEKIYRRMKRRDLSGRTITVKIKYYNFSVSTRSISGTNKIRNPDYILRACLKLLRKNPLKKPIRLLGISVSNFGDDQLSLWN